MSEHTRTAMSKGERAASVEAAVETEAIMEAAAEPAGDGTEIRLTRGQFLALQREARQGRELAAWAMGYTEAFKAQSYGALRDTVRALRARFEEVLA